MTDQEQNLTAEPTTESGGPSAPETLTSQAPASLDFDSYIGGQPEAFQDVLKKNGVDSFEKQEKWITNLQSLIGKKGLIEPGANASEEEVSAYRDQLLDKLGRPEDKEYSFSIPEGVPQEYVNQDFMDSLSELAYNNGLNGDGFQELVGHIYTAYAADIEAVERLKAENVSLKEALGKDGSVSDEGVSKSSPEDIRAEASKLAFEASGLHKQGKFAEASALRSRADKLYADYARLNRG